MPSPPSQSHRPRKKPKQHGSDALAGRNGLVIQEPESASQKPAFPLVAFLWPAKGTSQWVILPLILMAVGLFRWATGFWGYSGFQKPPMHGDFEAQRHWMEITTHLPMSQWYFHDLEWWGLDYPPLTAYHSWLFGKMYVLLAMHLPCKSLQVASGSLIDPTWFALRSSRGLETHVLKVYMRATVMVSDYLTYIPASIICLRHLAQLSDAQSWEASIALTALLLQPATILIDHGHFQYNTVMLGFVLASISSMIAGRLLWGCVFFVAALGFKQMALFYAPVVFAYLLGRCIFPRFNLPRLFSIAVATIASFAVLFLPLLLGAAYDAHRNIAIPSTAPPPPLLAALPFSVSAKSSYYPILLQLTQSIHRIFPFARGLFEDKVANIWCAIHSSGIHKLHNHPPTLLQRGALALTSLSILPPCAIIFLKPRKELLPWALAVCSWGFFLCSYQVHEKNVLLPLLPMTLLLAGDGGLRAESRAWVGLANVLGCWTMFPLLKRDELRVPYFVLTLLWAYLMGLPPTSLGIYTRSGVGGDGVGWSTTLTHAVFYAAMVAWHFAEAFVPTLWGKPDLWVVANVCIGAAGFGLCYLWCLWRLATQSGIFGAPRRGVEKERKMQ
ncbi:Glucosyltransferase-like protein [Elasticomyces elasticus]|nr:Glucosyltransferase-like protein [Elasticomyces elasticus]